MVRKDRNTKESWMWKEYPIDRYIFAGFAIVFSLLGIIVLSFLNFTFNDIILALLSVVIGLLFGILSYLSDIRRRLFYSK
ncbi:MAG: hypothetical protein V1870_01795 [Candidatus Aenigmatarchaeota archaeon]